MIIQIEKLFSSLKDESREVHVPAAVELEQLLNLQSRIVLEMLTKFIQRNYLWCLTRILSRMKWEIFPDLYNPSAYFKFLKTAQQLCKADLQLRDDFKPLLEDLKKITSQRFSIKNTKFEPKLVFSKSKVNLLEGTFTELILFKKKGRDVETEHEFYKRTIRKKLQVLENLKFESDLYNKSISTLVLENKFSFIEIGDKISCKGWLVKNKWGIGLDRITQIKYLK